MGMENLKQKLFDFFKVNNAEDAKKKFSELVDEPKKVEYKDLVLQDGSVLMLEGEMSVGSSVMVQTESGPAPAPDGEYVLQDGTKISIMGGKIAEVGKSEPAPEGMSSDAIKAGFEDFEKRIKSLEEALQNSQKNLTETQTAMKAQTEKFGKAVELIEKVLAMPAQEPIKQDQFNSVKEDKFVELSRTLIALKKSK